MKRKLVYLPSTYYSKDIVDDINSYFDKGYNIEGILDADTGFYLVLVLDDEYYSYTNKKYNRQNLIEESVNNNWSRTTTKDVTRI